MRLPSQSGLDQKEARAGSSRLDGTKRPGGSGEALGTHRAHGGNAPSQASPALLQGPLHWLLSPWVIALGLFFATLFLTTRHSDFPYYYEKDAHSKVAQVISGERNFYHPPLMLNATDVVLWVTQKPPTEENVILAGRFCMAFFTAVAVASLALFGYRLGGPGAALGVGVLLMTQNLVFDLAHNFKEDPALIFGLGLSFLAMQLFWERRTPGTAAFLGIAGALAVSGKYVGIAALPMGLTLLILARKELRPAHWLAFFVGYLGTIAIVDYQFVMQLGQFRDGFKTEIADLTRKDKLEEIPHLGEAFYKLKRFIPRALAVAMAFYLVTHFRRWSRDPVRWMLVLYPIVFYNVLLWSPRLFTRHFLPIFVILFVWAGLAIPLVAELIVGLIKRFAPTLRSRLIAPLPISLALVVVGYGFQHSALRSVYTAYSQSTRETMIDYINKEVSDDALIVCDNRAYLLDNQHKPRTDRPIRCQAITKGRLSEFGTLDAIYATGATHVLAHSVDSRYFFYPPSIENGPNKDAKKKGHKNRALLDDIRQNSKELLYLPAGSSIYIAPGLVLFELNRREGAPPVIKATQESLNAPADDAEAEFDDEIPAEGRSKANKNRNKKRNKDRDE